VREEEAPLRGAAHTTGSVRDALADTRCALGSARGPSPGAVQGAMRAVHRHMRASLGRIRDRCTVESIARSTPSTPRDWK
jgi:hypothetical protein